MKQFLFSLFVFFYFLNPSSAQWIQTNSLSGTVRVKSIIENDSIIIATAYEGCFYRTNLNEEWKQLTAIGLNEFVLNGDTIYAVSTTRGLYQMNFSAITAPIVELDANFYHSVDYHNGIIYQGSFEDGFSWSADNGATWTAHNSGIPVEIEQGNVSILADNLAHTDNYIFANTYGSIYRNTFSLGAWEQKINGLPAGYIFFIENVNDTLFIGSHNALYTSVDDGELWTLVYTAPSEIVSFYKQGSTIFLGTGLDGVLSSVDNGVNWSPLNNGITDSYVQCISSYSDTLVCGTFAQGFFKYVNNTWVLDNNGMNTDRIFSMSATSNNINVVCHSALPSSDVFKSAPNGDWTSVSPGLPYVHHSKLEASNDTIFLSTKDDLGPPSISSYILYSVDDGTSWTEIYVPPFANGDSYTIAYDQGTLYAQEDDEFHYSSDLGATWNNLNLPVGACNNYDAFEVIDGISFASFCGNQQLYKSENGLPWTPANNGVINSDIDFIGHCNGVWFTNHFYGGMYASFNEGLSWEYASYGLGTGKRVRDYLSYGSQLFVATLKGVYSTIDSGQNWYPLNEGLIKLSTGGIEILDDTLYVGTYGSGVWKRSIQDINQALSISQNEASVSSIKIYPNPSNGTFKVDLGDIKSNSEINILTASGKIMHTSEQSGGLIQFDLNLPAGMYFLSVQSAETNQVIKLNIK